MHRSLAATLCAILLGALAPAPATSQPTEARSPVRPDSAERDLALVRAAQRARQFGAPDAPVLLYEFFDYACPSCGAFHRTRADSIRQLFVDTRRVTLVPAPWPIPRLLRGWPAAEAALCAAAVGGASAFRSIHDALFTSQDVWSVEADIAPFLRRQAERTGVPLATWQRCIDDDRMVPLLLTDQRLAAAVRVTSTPTLLLLPRNAVDVSAGVVLDGFAPLDTIAAVVTRLSTPPSP
jgi:protein-disulfide isomerase